MLRTAFLLLLLVSATWLLGLLAVNSDALTFHYLFAAFSCLQVGPASVGHGSLVLLRLKGLGEIPDPASENRRGHGAAVAAWPQSVHGPAPDKEPVVPSTALSGAFPGTPGHRPLLSRCRGSSSLHRAECLPLVAAETVSAFTVHTEGFLASDVMLGTQMA